TDEVKDTTIDALKAKLKSATVLTVAVEKEEDQILGENNSNQPCDNNTSPTVDNNSDVADVHEDLVAVDEQFREEVNEVLDE
ncbi:hypothetical protein EJD97_009608, partial [Solanum chilense]